MAGGRSTRVALFIHAAELDEGMTMLKRFALRQARQIFANSEYTKRKAVRLGVRPDRIKIIPLGCEDPCPRWKPKVLSGDPLQILFVGRMDERYKGQMEFIDFVALLYRRFFDLR